MEGENAHRRHPRPLVDLALQGQRIVDLQAADVEQAAAVVGDHPGAQPARIKVLRTARGEGAGAPGTVLDDNLTIACGEGAVRLLEIQRAGKQPMRAEDFLRGTAVAPGTRLS